MPSSSGRLMARAQSDPRVFWRPPATARPGGETRGGFTLLEILVTIALIALLSAVLITGATRLLSDTPTAPADIFRKALADARQYAVLKNVEVRLSYDTDGKMFRLATPEGDKTYPVAVAGDLAIDFLAAQKGGSTVLLGGVLVETQKLASVTFYSDGTCSPFRVQIRVDASINVTAIDPWTCAPVLEEKS